MGGASLGLAWGLPQWVSKDQVGCTASGAWGEQAGWGLCKWEKCRRLSTCGEGGGLWERGDCWFSLAGKAG